MFFIDDTLHCFSLTTHGSFESAKQLGWGLALLPNVRRDPLPPMPMHGGSRQHCNYLFNGLCPRGRLKMITQPRILRWHTHRDACTVRRYTAFFFLVSCFARCLFCLRRLSRHHSPRAIRQDFYGHAHHVKCSPLTVSGACKN